MDRMARDDFDRLNPIEEPRQDTGVRRMKVEYSSNNSGGHWWLKDEDWKALEKAGWKVDWYANKKSAFSGEPYGERWLGALASDASKEFPSVQAAIDEWESITGQCADDEGCPCCGPPHSFG